jgi:hypothetical protein
LGPPSACLSMGVGPSARSPWVKSIPFLLRLEADLRLLRRFGFIGFRVPQEKSWCGLVAGRYSGDKVPR